MLRRYLKNPFQKAEPVPTSYPGAAMATGGITGDEIHSPLHTHTWMHASHPTPHSAQPIDPEHYFNRPDLMIDTIIGPGVSFCGHITYDHLLRIDGSFEGSLSSPKGSLVVGPRGSVVAESLCLFAAIIDGSVEADLTIYNLLVVRASAKIKGNITARWITLEAGASVSGSLSIDPNLDLFTDPDSPEEESDIFFAAGTDRAN